MFRCRSPGEGDLEVLTVRAGYSTFPRSSERCTRRFGRSTAPQPSASGPRTDLLGRSSSTRKRVGESKILATPLRANSDPVELGVISGLPQNDRLPDSDSGSPGYQCSRGRIIVWKGWSGQHVSAARGFANSRVGSRLAGWRRPRRCSGPGLDVVLTSTGTSMALLARGQSRTSRSGAIQGRTRDSEIRSVAATTTTTGKLEVIIGDPDGKAGLACGPLPPERRLAHSLRQRVQGLGRPPSDHRLPRPARAPRRPVHVTLSNGTPSTAALFLFRGLRIDVSLAPAMPRCTWLVDPITYHVRVIDRFRDTSFSLPIPTVAQLAGAAPARVVPDRPRH